jgi:hypothetical protein
MFLASRLRAATVWQVTDFAWAKAEQSFYFLLLLLVFAQNLSLGIFFDCCEDRLGQRLWLVQVRKCVYWCLLCILGAMTSHNVSY